MVFTPPPFDLPFLEGAQSEIVKRRHAQCGERGK
jgi:hypothetical protein